MDGELLVLVADEGVTRSVLAYDMDELDDRLEEETVDELKLIEVVVENIEVVVDNS